MTLAAIVPVWNGRDLLDRLLSSLEAQTARADETLVIDNGSTDGAPDVARARGARVIAMGHNAGFAPAVNRGIEEARSDWIAILNSDVELAPDYFATLIAALQSSDAWFATGKILSANDPTRIDATFDLICRGATALRAGNGRPDAPLFNKPREIHSAPLTAALFRSSLFTELKKPARSALLPPAPTPSPHPLFGPFHSYLEDTDLSLRCAARHLTGLYVPAAVARHRGSAALGRWHPETVRLIARNQLLLAARHYSARHLWPILVAQSLWGLVAMRHGAGLAWFRGKWQGLRQFSTARNTREAFDPEVLESFLRGNERLIREIQSVSGFDLYWKLYFLLTRGGTK